MKSNAIMVKQRLKGLFWLTCSKSEYSFIFLLFSSNKSPIKIKLWVRLNVILTNSTHLCAIVMCHVGSV